MTDSMDPQAVEQQSQVEHEQYKVYKRRWLVLFAMFCITMAVGLHRSLISITDILTEYMNMTMENYNRMTQISMCVTLLTVLIMARALDYFGLRRLAYIACMMIICANSLKALCCANDQYVTPWVKRNRYHILLLSEVFVGLAQSISLCIPAKVASVWFAAYENTLALVIANCGLNIGVGISNYFIPNFITHPNDMWKLSFVFLISAVLLTSIVLICVTRSSPRIPPSSSAMLSASPPVPLKNGIKVMISNSSYLLLITTLSLNTSTLGIEQLVLEDILKSENYENSNNFCGTLIAHSYFFGTFFMLIAASWVDNSANFVKVSRMSSLICALTIASFNISIILPNIKNIILVTNIMASFGCSLMYPALFQVSLRSAVSILPEATVSAIVIVLQQIFSGVLMNLLDPLKKLSRLMTVDGGLVRTQHTKHSTSSNHHNNSPDGYQAPLLIFASFIVFVNLLYVTTFKAPSRDELQERLRCCDREAIMSSSSKSRKEEGGTPTTTTGTRLIGF